MYGWLLLILILVGCSAQEKNELIEGQEASVSVLDQKIIAENLQTPWAINKSGDVFYISERTGTIMKIEGNKKTRQKVTLNKPLATAAEAGLLGLVLAPDFTETSKAYAYYTYVDEQGQFNRIVSLRLINGEWKEEQLLLDRIPSGRFHHGGRLKIGPDQKLYATTGDAATDPEVAQDISSLGGKILRLNLDGSVPSDNPFPNSYVYSYGHRNPQGLAWSTDGTLYESEHGASAHDEINRIQAGSNYGWPLIQGNEKQSGMEAPLFQSGSNETWAPSGMVYDNGKLFVATLRGNAVREFNLTSMTSKKLIANVGRIRDVYIEGDNLFFVTNNTDGRGNPAVGDDKLYSVQIE